MPRKTVAQAHQEQVLILCPTMAPNSGKYLGDYGYDLLLGLIAAFYVFMVPYTKVEESFNVQVTLIHSTLLICVCLLRNCKKVRDFKIL